MVGTWGVILTIRAFFKDKYWPSIKIKISTTFVYKEFEVQELVNSQLVRETPPSKENHEIYVKSTMTEAKVWHLLKNHSI